MGKIVIMILFIALLSACREPGKESQTITSYADTSKLFIALLQLNPVGADVEANMKKGEEYCRKAKSMGADIVLFPEMWSIGYSRYHWPGSDYKPERYPLGFEEWKDKALSSGSAFMEFYQKLAGELGLAIVITYLEEWPGLPRNSATVIDSEGTILMTYAKVHTSDMKVTESNCTPGDDFYVCRLPVRNDTVCIGIMTCFDREFPESARILMLKGAEIILTPNACKLEEKRINQFQTRAVENALGVAMANYAAPSQNGHSCAFDADGDMIVVAGEEEEIVMASFDIESIRKHRARTSWGNAYRRPGKYGLITSDTLQEIFVRENGIGETFDRQKR